MVIAKRVADMYRLGLRIDTRIEDYLAVIGTKERPTWVAAPPSLFSRDVPVILSFGAGQGAKHFRFLVDPETKSLRSIDAESRGFLVRARQWGQTKK